ncbi:MAG: aldehyde dehydrogenase family protein [Planctomycetota bacterium]
MPIPTPPPTPIAADSPLWPQLCASLRGAADDWVAASAASKGWRHLPGVLAEEWASGPLPVARFLACLHARLARREPALGPAEPVPGAPDLVRHRVLPLRAIHDPLLLHNHGAEIHVRRDASPHRPAGANGQHALVLGAGNVTATPILDALEYVFVRSAHVTLKLSPLHGALLPVFTRALQPLLASGHLTFATGDASAGAALARRPEFTAVHLTGSAATWAALRGDPDVARKELHGEVGCCTPVFVVPGRWREHELDHAARQLAAFVATNGGATCLAPRLLLTAQAWPQRATFLARIDAAMAALPARVPFHPGTRSHYEHATGRSAPPDALPPVLCRDRSRAEAAGLAAAERFAPVLNELALPGDGAAAFLAAATAFVGEAWFGALSAYVFSPPAMLRAEHAAIDAAIARLRHGTIAINTWTGLGYGLGTTPWGVPPGSPIECGSGQVRNLTGTAVQRVVVRAPFRPFPLPPWLPHHRRGEQALRALTLHTLRPTLAGMLTVALHAVRS